MMEQRQRKRTMAATDRITMLETPVSPFLAAGAAATGAGAAIAGFFLEPFGGIMAFTWLLLCSAELLFNTKNVQLFYLF